jgi:hypothetical protein
MAPGPSPTLLGEQSKKQIQYPARVSTPAHQRPRIKGATALAACLPYHRHYLTDLFAGSGSLLKGASNETTRDTFALELALDAPDFIAAALLHLPPKGQQTVRYYGLYLLPGRRSKNGSPMTSQT